MSPASPAARRLTFEIFRFNAAAAHPEPRMERFEIEETPYMSLFIALNTIRETMDPSLQFDFACRSAICGSCGMMVNGKPVLGCRTLTADLPDLIRLQPLPVFKLIGDLSVDTGVWFREMAASSEAWIHAKDAFNPHASEERMDDELAATLYESDRCIECGCCVAACGVARVANNFKGPAGLNRIARFMMDPRDERDDSDWFDVFANEDGVFGCLGLMACHDICPKELPLLEVYAYLRRKALTTARRRD